MKNNEMELLLRSFDDSLDESDQRRFDELLAGSGEARRELARHRHVRRLVSEESREAFDPGFADRVMEQVTQSASEPVTRADRGPRTRQLRRRLPFAIGAAFALLVLVYYVSPRTASAPFGETRSVALADGSTVELSPGSIISYRLFWGRDQRRLSLDGEAFFDVVPSGKPFVVETFNADVTVLGTQFNVRAWEDDILPETAVAVAVGRVGVRSRTSQTEVVVQPGEATSVVADSAAVPEPAPLDQILTWRSGGLAFAEQPLGTVFNTLERRFDVDVEVTDRRIRHRALTYLNPNPTSAEEVLSDICHTLDLRYRRTATGYEVLPN